jgi:NAD(P)H-flavin reductase
VPISISGDPAEPGRLQHTVRDVGDATRALVAAGPGSVLLVRGPYGVGWGVEDAQDGDLLVVAGGIGLAPVRPALLAAVAGRRDYRRIVVLIGARSPGELLFTQEVDRWLADTDLDVALTVDAAPAGWRGRVGLVTSLLPKDLDATRTLALVCGPEIMMRLTSEALLDRGVPAGRIRVSMERNMKCGIGLCGHCQLRELFICVDGPVLAYDRVRSLMTTQEL